HHVKLRDRATFKRGFRALLTAKNLQTAVSRTGTMVRVAFELHPAGERTSRGARIQRKDAGTQRRKKRLNAHSCSPLTTRRIPCLTNRSPKLMTSASLRSSSRR